MKRNKTRETPREYYKKITRPDGTTGWQGCKDLALSAEYTPAFCRALLRCWVQASGIDP